MYHLFLWTVKNSDFNLIENFCGFMASLVEKNGKQYSAVEDVTVSVLQR